MIIDISNRGPNILIDLIDSNTGEYLTVTKVTKYYDGTPITDANCDGVIYWKHNNEYFKRNYSGFINAKWYGAVGTGDSNTTDDTAAIQAAINNCPPNGTVAIYEDMVCNVTTLNLKSNINFICYGKLKQLTANNLPPFSIPENRQNSNTPLLSCNNISNVNIEVHSAISNYEGVLLLNCSNISICNSSFNGNVSPSGYPCIALWTCDHITIKNNEIFNFGQPRSSVTEYKNGAGIRALTVNYLDVSNNKIYNNGDNGVFTNTCKYVSIDFNEVYNNGLSGIQIAFGGAGTEYDYQITNNKIHNNMADTIDVNNGSYAIIDIKMVISGNIGISNGFVGSLPTPDGSGIATLINVSNVIVKNNSSSHCNKSTLYISGCKWIIADNNTSDLYLEIVGSFDRVEIKNNNLQGGINVLSGAAGKFLNIQSNSIANISLPNGISIDQLLIEENNITTCNINFNLTGSVSFIKNNTLNSTATATNSFYIAAVSNGLLIENNIINQTSDADCINIAVAVPGVRIINNKLTSKNNVIFDAGAPYLVVEGNKLTGVAGGNLPARTFFGTPNNAQLRNNTHASPANTIRLISGTLFLNNENFISGFQDYGTAVVKNASFI